MKNKLLPERGLGAERAVGPEHFRAVAGGAGLAGKGGQFDAVPVGVQ